MTRTALFRTAIVVAACVLAGGLYAADPPAKPGAPPAGQGGPPGAGGPPPPMPVEAAVATVEAVSDMVSAVGSLQANESVVIRPEIAGRITGIKFNEGQVINRNDVLFLLDATEYEAQMAQSKANLQLADMKFNRAKDLREKSLISQQDYDDSEAKLAEAQAQFAVDKSRLDKTVIRAPFSGILGVRNVSPGAYVRPGDDLVSLEETNPVKLEFRVPETYARSLRVGQKVSVGVDAYPDDKFTGSVYAIDPRVDTQTHSLLLRALVPNQKRALLPGMFARVELILATRSEALVVPEQAVVPMGNDLFVYRIVDGKAAQTRVQTGRRMQGKVEITSGLSKGDSVITAGQKVRDGMAVKTGGGAPEKDAKADAKP